MIDKIYTAECYAQNVIVEFYINDIPISLRGPGFGSFWGAPINQYLVNKDNKICMIIKPGDIPSRAKTGPVTGRYLACPGAEERALMRICSYPKGALIGGPDANEISRIVWPEKRMVRKNVEINDFESANYPLAKEEKFSVGKIFKVEKSYQKATSLKVNEKIKLNLSQFLEELHGYIEKGDADKFIELTSFRILDNADSYGKSINENISLIRDGFKRNMGLNSWELSGLDPQSYDFRLCANDKMVHCIAGDWKPIIREAPGVDNASSYYDIFVSLIKGRWQVVL